MRSYRCVFWLLIIGSLGSCTAAKFLQEEEKFLANYSIIVEDPEHTSDLKPLITTLYEVVNIDPNERVLGMRPAVWIHESLSDKRENRVNKFIKNNLGKTPVLYDPAIMQKDIRLLENRLFNSGHFNGKVSCRMKEKDKNILLRYEVRLNEPYQIEEIVSLKDTTAIAKEINANASSSLIKKGDVYSLEVLKTERTRINEYLKNKGFYYFNPELLLFEVDSTLGNHRLKMKMSIKAIDKKSTLDRYTLGNITVFPNYTLEQDSTITLSKANESDGISFKDPHNKFRESLFKPLISLHSDSLYRISDHHLTLKRLSDLNAFKFMNLRFQKSDGQSHILHANIYLTPEAAQSFRMDIEAVSKSNNFFGPELSVDYRNRNVWKGAETLVARLSGGFETQIVPNQENINSYEIGLSLSLIIPKFISPIPFKIPASSEIPKTEIQIGYQLLKRSSFYRINKTSGHFGYVWHSNRNHFHQLNPINLNYVFLSSSTAEFDLLLDNNPSLKQSFEDQFIIGGSYSYTFSNKTRQNRRKYWYFNTNIDLSGNVANTLHSALNDDEEKKGALFGLPFAQYSRVDFDLRYFFTLSEGHILATRLLMGVGIPYGNTDQLPYIKQFFIGGSNSIRAFVPRGIGPGSYQTTDNNTLFIDQSGDIKMEATLEYRTKIYGVLKGALFADAGNVWLINEDESRPGGQFRSSNVWSQTALGIGAGLRLDFSYFVLRFDWAFPLKKPFVTESNGWVIDEIDFSNKEWRQDNLILNVAIGYSF